MKKHLMFALACLVAIGFVGVSWLGSARHAPRQVAVAIPFPQIPRITPQHALALKNAVFVDVRGRKPYQKEHIKGALCISRWHLNRDRHLLPQGVPLVLYCT